MGDVEGDFGCSGDVTRYSECRSFFYLRLSTNTCCECTRVTRLKSDVQDAHKVSVDRKKKTKGIVPGRVPGRVPGKYFPTRSFSLSDI